MVINIEGNILREHGEMFQFHFCRNRQFCCVNCVKSANNHWELINCINYLIEACSNQNLAELGRVFNWLSRGSFYPKLEINIANYWC